MIITHTDRDNRLHVVYDDEHTTPAETYDIWLANASRWVTTQPGESPAAVWQRVLDTVAAMRAAIALSSGHLYFATVYVGSIQRTEQHQQSHIKDRISVKLYELADPANNRNANSRVKALVALAELYGLNQPQTVYVTLPTLEQLDAEIAQRKGQ